MNPNPSIVRSIIAASLITVFAGCAGTPKTTTAADGTQQEESYTYVTEVGSRIPKKVKTTKPSSSSQNSEQITDTEAARRMAEERIREQTTTLNRRYGG